MATTASSDPRRVRRHWVFQVWSDNDSWRRIAGFRFALPSLATKVRVGCPINKTPSGKPIPEGLQIISLDTNQIKDMVHYRLSPAAEQCPMAAYLHKETGQDYARHILAEEKRRDEKDIDRWVKTRQRNDLFDCEGYAHICADPYRPTGGIHLLPTRQMIEQRIQ
jgi:phage terminase large subunit GpA-like protein